MKILYMVTTMSLGGAEAQVVRMACNVAKENSVVVVSLMKPTYDRFLEELKGANVRFYSLDMERGKMSVTAYSKYIRLVKHFKPDIIHSHMIHANYLTRLAKPFLMKYPTINTIHGEEEFLGKRCLLYRLTDPFVKLITCVGNELYKKAEHNRITKSNKLLTVYNGIDTNMYKYSIELKQSLRQKYYVNEDSYVWVTVGRLEKVKNYAYLIKEFHYLLESMNKKATLIFIGDGQQKVELEHLVNKMDISEHVKFLGRCSNVNELLTMGDAFVLSSLYEGLPLSLQEAASIGLPLVATNVGGCYEIIKNEHNGYLVYDYEKGSLACAMDKIMKLTETEYQSYSEYSRKIVSQNFELNNVMSTWMKIYRRLQR